MRRGNGTTQHIGKNEMVQLLSHTLLAQSRVLIFLALGVSEIIMNLFAGIARRRYFIVPGRECGLNF